MAARAAWMAPGRARVSTFLVCPKAQEVAAFAKDIFGAEEVRPPLFHSDGRLWNHELVIGDCTIMLGEASEGLHRPGFVYIHVPDAQTVWDAAVAAGAKPVMEPEDQFYGDFDGGVEDMGGNLWWISTHRHSLSPAEIETAARAAEAKRAGAQL